MMSQVYPPALWLVHPRRDLLGLVAGLPSLSTSYRLVRPDVGLVANLARFIHQQ